MTLSKWCVKNSDGTANFAKNHLQSQRRYFGRKWRYCRARQGAKTILANFRNSYHPRIAVTVDMIATGTDVRPLECLLFMRDVKKSKLF